MGIFQFGVPSIVGVFDRGRIEFDEDLTSTSRRAVAVKVEVGMSLGRSTE